MHSISLIQMGNSKFDFQHFSINQEHSAMKVGTDGVLIGAWTNPSVMPVEGLKILDIGTGTGLIALMMAQRFPEALIHGIEIDHAAAEEAKLNVENSPWSNRVTIIEASLNKFAETIDDNTRYDLIVTNPPFYNATLKPEDDNRAAARHYDSLPFSDITRFADKHLSDNGSLAVIYPVNCEQNIMIGISTSKLSFNTICDVVTKEGKPCKRRMGLFTKNTSLLKHEILTIRNSDNSYSEEYRELTKEFYIKL